MVRICVFHTQGRGSIPREEAFYMVPQLSWSERSAVICSFVSSSHRKVAGSNPAGTELLERIDFKVYNLIKLANSIFHMNLYFSSKMLTVQKRGLSQVLDSHFKIPNSKSTQVILQLSCGPKGDRRVATQLFEDGQRLAR